MNALKLAELTSDVGALVLGVGVGGWFAQFLDGFATAILVTGVTLSRSSDYPVPMGKSSQLSRWIPRPTTDEGNDPDGFSEVLAGGNAARALLTCRSREISRRYCQEGRWGAGSAVSRRFFSNKRRDRGII